MSNDDGRFVPSLDSVAKKLHLPFGVPDFVDDIVKGTSNRIGERVIKTLVKTWDATGGGPFAVGTAGGLATSKAVDATMDMFLGPVFERILKRLGMAFVVAVSRIFNRTAAIAALGVGHARAHARGRRSCGLSVGEDRRAVGAVRLRQRGPCTLRREERLG